MKEIVNKLKQEREKKQRLLRFRDVEDETLRLKLIQDDKARFEYYYSQMLTMTLKDAIEFIMEKETDVAFDRGYFWALKNIDEQIS